MRNDGLALPLWRYFWACRPATAEEIPLTSRGSTYSLPVRLNDEITLDFVLDTGASDMAIPSDVVSTLRRTGTLTDGDFIGKGVYTQADGTTLPGQRFILREVAIGDQSVRNVVAHVSPINGASLLGQSFLSRLPAWTINYGHHALVVGNTIPNQRGPFATRRCCGSAGADQCLVGAI